MGVGRPLSDVADGRGPQRAYALREVVNGWRWLARAGAPWRLMPNDLPPWTVVYQQTRRWLAAGVFETLVHELRVLLRLAQGRAPLPSATILDSRTIPSTPESSARAGDEGAKRRKGSEEPRGKLRGIASTKSAERSKLRGIRPVASKVHGAVDTLGHLRALRVTAANEQDRAQVAALGRRVQERTGENIESAFVDQGYTGEQAREEAAAQGIALEVVKLPEAQHGFVLLARR